MILKARQTTSKVLVIAGLAVIAAWLHSHWIGWQSEWSDSETMVGSRIVSSNGQLYYQRCSLQPPRTFMELNGQQKLEPLQMPRSFCVGSNPNGKRQVITIAKFPVPFSQPHPGQFFSLHGQGTYQNSKDNGSWFASTHELLVAYWLVTLVIAFILFSSWYANYRQGQGEPNESESQSPPAGN